MQKLQKKVAVLGWYGYRNIGDELILYSLLKKIRSFANITIISKNPKESKNIYGEKSITYLDLFIKINEFRILIMGGGQIFNDRRRRTIPLWILYFSLLRLINPNLKIYLINQGLEVYRKISYILLRNFLKFIDSISVRDLLSYNILKKIYNNNNDNDINIHLGPDIVFTLYPEIKKIKKINNKNFIGINFRHKNWWSNKANIKLTINLIKRINKLSNITYYLPFRLPGIEKYDDLIPFLKELKNDEIKIYIPKFNKNLFKSLFNLFGMTKFFIGTSYHSLVLSYLFNIPFLSIPYQKKCNIFMKNNGLSYFLISDKSDLNKIKKKKLKLYHIFMKRYKNDNIKKYKYAYKAHINPLIKELNNFSI